MSQTSEPQSPHVVNTEDQTFEQDVFERSKKTPVVLDFWSPSCMPCRMLSPILENLADEHNGRFVLVKAQTEMNMKGATEFNVRGIPAVFAIVDGDVVDYFEGALPAEAVSEWLERVYAAGDVVEARRLEDADAPAAESKYRELLQQSPDNAVASIGLARTLLAQDKGKEAGEIVEELEKRGFLEPEAEQLKATLQLQSKGDVDLAEARSSAEAAPDDLEIQLRYAEALAAHLQFAESMEKCLEIIQREKTGVGERAREVMVDLFRVAPDEELVRDYRRKLSMLLY